ncbi:MAG: hypothetical protein SH818_04860 [Saprospiraceae bacterium]|nr:hypothetical protein [Saprospiraceae bacterium]
MFETKWLETWIIFYFYQMIHSILRVKNIQNRPKLDDQNIGNIRIKNPS